MGTRGPAPAREAERRRISTPPHPLVKVGPTSHLPFDVDFAPPWPDAPEGHMGKNAAGEDDWIGGWHPFVVSLWESLKVDPSRLWTGPGAIAANFAMCENLSRLLSPRIAATIPATEYGDARVIREEIPLNGSELAGVLKWLAMVGVYEGDRLRIQKEITFHPAPDLAPMEDSNAIVADRMSIIQGGKGA